jgi:hypothetical protein
MPVEHIYIYTHTTHTHLITCNFYDAQDTRGRALCEHAQEHVMARQRKHAQALAQERRGPPLRATCGGRVLGMVPWGTIGRT